MALRSLPDVQDGDQERVVAYEVRDKAGAVLDLSSCAVDMRIMDEAGALICTRPGVPQSPKSSGIVYVYLRGKETDWEGLGKTLIVQPTIYMAVAQDGSVATNLLVNPSFDSATGTNPARLPDSWTLIGARTAVWDNYANDAAPPMIFGTFQLVNHSGLGDPDYIQQAPAVTLAVGDPISVGCWHRMGQAAQAKNNNHAIFFHPGSEANTIAQFEVVESDWYFLRGTVVTTVAASAATMGLDARGTTGSNRYDDAFLFKGSWKVTRPEYFTIKVQPRPRVPKSSNQVAGVGSFEQDSDANGIGDGWAKIGAGGTFTIDKDPANVSLGSASQKIVLTDQSSMSLKYVHRGRFKVGDTWRASVKVKTSGTLGSGAGTGGFNVELSTQYFEPTPKTNAATNLGVTLATFTDHQASLAIATADRSELMIIINLNGKTGTMWIDDVRLERTVAGP